MLHPYLAGHDISLDFARSRKPRTLCRRRAASALAFGTVTVITFRPSLPGADQTTMFIAQTTVSKPNRVEQDLNNIKAEISQMLNSLQIPQPPPSYPAVGLAPGLEAPQSTIDGVGSQLGASLSESSDGGSRFIQRSGAASAVPPPGPRRSTAHNK